MSETEGVASCPRRRTRGRWFKYIAFRLLLVVGAGLGLRAYVLHVTEKRLQAAVANLDRVDPGWRWEEVLAGRAQIPDEQNGARQVLAAATHLPKNWPQTPAAPRQEPAEAKQRPADHPVQKPEEGLPDRLAKVEPGERLDPNLTTSLRAELKALAPALAEARKLIGTAQGRYKIVWEKNLLATLVPHLEQARCVARLLELDAALRAQDGDLEGAFASSRCIINAGRSIGDEPLFISQLVRMACQQTAVRSMERVLAQGTVSKEALQVAQKQLEDEAAQPLLWIALRGERASTSLVMERLYNGEITLDQLTDGRSQSPGWYDRLYAWLFVRPVVHNNQVVWLEIMTRWVETAKLPPAQRMEAFERLADDLSGRKPTSAYTALAVLFLPAAHKASKADNRVVALLQCAQAALAAERYRLLHGTWPASLQRLVPAFLTEVPDDPFGGGALHYRRLADGVVVYSVGPDKTDNGGTLDRNDPARKGADLGFRLWDVKRRRQPPAPKPPALPEKK